MSWTVFDLTINDHIAHIQFNRPQELNSFNVDMWQQLPLAAAEIEADGDVRVVIISSTGKHFTAGMDLSVFASLSATGKGDPARSNASFMDLVKTLQETFSPLTRLSMPVIAAIQGGCIGAGLDLASACDLRYVSSDAFFSLHEVNIGMMADVGTFPRLQQLIPLGIAREMAFTGEPLRADRAERIGLANGIFQSHEDLIAGVFEVAKKIALKSPLAISGSKQMLNYGVDHTTSDTLDHVAIWQAGMFSLADIQAGVTAQQNKQLPDYASLADKKVLKQCTLK